MQTDSVLDAQDREIMWRWGQPATREFFTENASNCSRIAGELSRLEQENQRLQARVDSLDCAHKLAMGEVERLTKENTDSFKKAAQDECLRQAREANPWIARETDPDLQCLREKVAHEHSQNIALHKAIKKRDDLIKGLELSLRGAIVDLERQRDKDADGTTTRDALTAARAEVQRLRENAEIDKAQRAEWQETIDKLEEENERLRSELEKPHDHGPKPKERHFEFTIGDGDMRIADLEGDVDQAKDRISTLEGRVQGITEIVKQELAIIVERLRELEERVNRPSLVQEFVNSCTAEVRRLRAEMEQPVPPARNPFEDLRPPRGL